MPVVAVIVIVDEPVGVGIEAHVIGFGVGGSSSGIIGSSLSIKTEGPYPWFTAGSAVARTLKRPSEPGLIPTQRAT